MTGCLRCLLESPSFKPAKPHTMQCLVRLQLLRASSLERVIVVTLCAVFSVRFLLLP
jgi:hypothetical protein